VADIFLRPGEPSPADERLLSDVVVASFPLAPFLYHAEPQPTDIRLKDPRRALAQAAPATIIVAPLGVASAEAFGTTAAALVVTPSSIPGAEAFGAPRVALVVAPSGIGSAEALGAPRLAAIITPSSIASAEAFGTARVAVTSVVAPTGIPTAQAFGVARLALVVSATGIASSAAFGVPRVAEVVAASGIPSAEAFGTAAIAERVTAAGISSAEAFGTARIGSGVAPTGIASAEAFGAPRVDLELGATGIPSSEAFGTLEIAGGVLVVLPVGIQSGEAFGALVVVAKILLGSMKATSWATWQGRAADARHGAGTAKASDRPAYMMIVGGSMSYNEGDQIHASNEIRSTTAPYDRIDPTTLCFKLQRPDGSSRVYTYGTDAEIVRDSKGVYYMLIDTTGAPGRYVGRWWSTGVGQSATPWEAWVAAANL
jgi:hypothetical protein